MLKYIKQYIAQICIHFEYLFPTKKKTLKFYRLSAKHLCLFKNLSLVVKNYC